MRAVEICNLSGASPHGWPAPTTFLLDKNSGRKAIRGESREPAPKIEKAARVDVIDAHAVGSAFDVDWQFR